jgi:hypothetical protein
MKMEESAFMKKVAGQLASTGMSEVKNEGLEVVGFAIADHIGNFSCIDLTMEPSLPGAIECKDTPLCRHSAALAGYALLRDELDDIRADRDGCAHQRDQLRAELAAIKAQVPVTAVSEETFSSDGTSDIITCNLPISTKLYAAPAAKQVVMPERRTKADYSCYIGEFASEAAAIHNSALDAVANLNAADQEGVV